MCSNFVSEHSSETDLGSSGVCDASCVLQASNEGQTCDEEEACEKGDEETRLEETYA